MELPLGEHAELYPEVAFQSQQEPADEQNRWWQFDPRVEWLIDTLKMLKKYKVLVICAHAETALDLEDALRVRSGIPATVFHEGMSILERDRAAAYFADEEFGAQVLICSEIGSEGRNFQFSHHLRCSICRLILTCSSSASAASTVSASSTLSSCTCPIWKPARRSACSSGTTKR